MVPGRVLALDVGKVRIGVALSDPLGYTAQPLVTIWRKGRGDDLRSVARLVRKHQAARVLVGNPLHLSGDQTPWGLKVQAFAASLRERLGDETPVEMWDERLSTVAAHEILNEQGFGTERRKIIDQVAAVVILEGWMQAAERTRGQGGEAAQAEPETEK